MIEGFNEGSAVGERDGIFVVGITDGDVVGTTDGNNDGKSVGDLLG